MDAVMKTEQKEVVDWAVQNDNKPLWTRSPREVRPLEIFTERRCCQCPAYQRCLVCTGP